MAVVTLKNKKDFDRIFKHKKVFGNKHLTLLYRNNGLTYNRCAFIVSKKVSKKAVVRNKIRRRLKNILIIRSDRLVSGYDLVFLAKSKTAEIDYQTLSHSVDHLFYKTDLFKPINGSDQVFDF